MSKIKICHLCLVGPYNNGWNYQENILPKYHVKMGLDVTQIVTRYMWDNNKIVISDEQNYTNDDGVKIIRLHEKKGLIGGTRLNKYPDACRYLEEIKPDILFIHDVQNLEIPNIVKYLKRNKCTVYVDNHSDFSNSAKNFISRNILHKLLWKHMANLINPYVTKFYGVLPARVDFLVNVYKLPKDKCELLIMGADDEKIDESIKKHSRDYLRNRFSIKDDEFLIVTGGKIDAYKYQVVLLAKAIKNIDNVKLIIFGSIDENIDKELNPLVDGKKIISIGWIRPYETYDYFEASDLVCFPGRHSVLWEQAVAQKKPLIVKYWDGTTHVDRGGNALFLHKDSEEEIKTKIESLFVDNKYQKMQSIADKVYDDFLYSKIAKKSIKYD